jgi:hypothetical protein
MMGFGKIQKKTIVMGYYSEPKFDKSTRLEVSRLDLYHVIKFH